MSAMATQHDGIDALLADAGSGLATFALPDSPGVTGAASLSLNVPGEALDWARASGHLRAIWDYTQMPQVERVKADLLYVMENPVK